MTSRAALLAGATLALLAAAGCRPPPPPNIVLIIGDDLGYPDHGFTGSTIVQTPHLDQLAAEGTVFRNGFNSASTCRPSHITLLTGLHPAQWEASNASHEIGSRRRPFEWISKFDTLPRKLRAAGYATFEGGKLWEGRTFGQVGFSHGTRKPVVRGKLDTRPFARALRDSRHRKPRSYRVDSNGAEQPPEETTPDIAFTLGRSTMEPLWTFLDEHSDQPFFIWFAPTLPHTPFDAGPEFTRLYAGAGLSAGARAYYANITRFDAVVGQLLRRIDDSGLRERTLVVYLTDNGWDQEPKSDHAWHLGGPRGKFSIRDPGFRTPLVFRWPGWIEAGEVHDDLVSTVDLFPTLLGLAHIETPPGRMGVDLAPTLLNGDASPREAVMGGIRSLRTPNGRISNERAWFLRTHETRYVWYEKRDEEELFDLTRDPREESNIASEDPDLTRELRERLQRWIARAREPIY